MGQFIAIEGGDGSGKRTQASLLAKDLRKQGYDVLEISFPQHGKASAYYVDQYLNGAYGSADDVPGDLASLPYAIDRFAAKAQIVGALSKPKGIVIADRYLASNLAHQGTKFADPDSRRAFYERDMQLEYELLGIPRPDLNIVLLVPTALAQVNVDRKDAGAERQAYTTKQRDIHEADQSHLERAKANYEELCRLYPHEFIAIQCTKDSQMRPIDVIAQAIARLVATRL